VGKMWDFHISKRFSGRPVDKNSQNITENFWSIFSIQTQKLKENSPFKEKTLFLVFILFFALNCKLLKQ
jgi:hypothetical protein